MNTFHALFLASALFTGAVSNAQDARFPQLEGETAKGEQILLPVKGGKAWTIIGMAYGQQAQTQLEEWYEPAYLLFVAKHGLFAHAYDAQVYFVPLFVGLNKAAYEPSMKKFKKSAAPEVVDHVLFCKAELGPLQESLGLERKDTPYFFVIDADGRIVHRTSGQFTDDKLQAIEEILLN